MAEVVTVGILTVSDSSARGLREDVSGPAVGEYCASLGWQVRQAAVIPDDEAGISETLRRWTDKEGLSLILTTGGTGLATRDVTPEATRACIEREIPGLAELMRSSGLQHTRRSVLSRAVAGSRGATLIVNLPGSPKGAVESLQSIQDLIVHATDLLHGRTAH